VNALLGGAGRRCPIMAPATGDNQHRTGCGGGSSDRPRTSRASALPAAQPAGRPLAVGGFTRIHGGAAARLAHQRYANNTGANTGTATADASQLPARSSSGLPQTSCLGSADAVGLVQLSPSAARHAAAMTVGNRIHEDFRCPTMVSASNTSRFRQPMCRPDDHVAGQRSWHQLVRPPFVEPRRRRPVMRALGATA
jgi:hypothetical protein